MKIVTMLKVLMGNTGVKGKITLEKCMQKLDELLTIMEDTSLCINMTKIKWTVDKADIWGTPSKRNGMYLFRRKFRVCLT